MSNPLLNRYEFVYLFDVENGNPNGDPDAGNMPRVDPQTNHGLVTDVCLKRKIRNYIEIARGLQAGYGIFIREKGVLNQLIERPYVEDEETKSTFAAWQEWSKNKKGKERPKKHYEDAARDWMCQNFYDVRAFGAVMTTGDKRDGEENKSKLKRTAGQVRGPVQINFARSIEPIMPLEVSITRMAVTNERDLEKERTMGRKHIVPYALYRTEGYISAKLAERTGFSEEDLKILWEALENMFDHDHSAARGKMNARGLYIFKHESALGNAPAHKLFSSVEIARQNDQERAARCFADYSVKILEDKLPQGVSFIEGL